MNTLSLPLRRAPWLILFFLFALAVLSGCGNSGSENRLQVGDAAPDFTLTALTGDKLRLKDWAGAPVILRFWSTECIYCRADTPVFNDYFKRYGEKGLKMVYINFGADAEEVDRFVRELHIPFPVAMDKNGTVAALYQVKAVPQTIFIGPDGNITAAVLGGVGKAELDKLAGKYFP